MAHRAYSYQRWYYIKCYFTQHAKERLRLREEELVKNYGVEIISKIRIVIDEFCNKEVVDTNRLNDKESYCEKLGFNDLYLVMLFARTYDERRIITLFPTNKQSTIRKFCHF